MLFDDNETLITQTQSQNTQIDTQTNRSVSIITNGNQVGLQF